MLQGYEYVRHDRASVDGRLLLAASLDPATREWAIGQAGEFGVATFDVDAKVGAMSVLKAFDATLCASGTISLESVLADAIPVIAYRVGLTTEITARLFVRTPFVGLPNILLGRPVFTELLQREVRPYAVTRALANALDQRPKLLEHCHEVAAQLGEDKRPSRTVASMLAPWLGPTVSVRPDR